MTNLIELLRWCVYNLQSSSFHCSFFFFLLGKKVWYIANLTSHFESKNLESRI
jgi:hypothetical protein